MPFSAPTNIGRWPKLFPITTSSLGNCPEPAFIAFLPELARKRIECDFIEGRRQPDCNRPSECFSSWSGSTSSADQPQGIRLPAARVPCARYSCQAPWRPSCRSHAAGSCLRVPFRNQKRRSTVRAECFSAPRGSRLRPDLDARPAVCGDRPRHDDLLVLDHFADCRQVTRAGRAGFERQRISVDLVEHLEGRLIALDLLEHALL